MSSTTLKVAFFSYPSSFQNIGGGEIVLLKMHEYLNKAGCSVKLFDMWNDRIEDFDVLHVFGTVKDCLGLISVAKSRGVTVVITPIIWSSFKRAFHTFGSPKEKAELFIRHAVKVILPFFPSSRRKMLLMSDLILPNADSEKQIISRLFAIPQARMKTVPNGVDLSFAGGSAELFREKFGVSGFILSIGRIEPRKNQLKLIRAVKGLNKKLVLIGNPVSGFESYAEKCRKEGEGFTVFIPAFSHDDILLKSAYKAAEVYVLPGWFETPGLVAMEAALAGAKLAVTAEGSTRDYFGNNAVYFDPSSEASIRDAVSAAVLITDEQVRSLKEKMKRECLWESVAAQTIRSYEEAVEKRKAGSL